MYMLISCEEREIGEPVFFETKESARLAMAGDVANVLGVPEKDVYESYVSFSAIELPSMPS